MEKVTFGSLPTLVKIGTGLAILSAWIIFEEVVIDRYGIWEVLPNYKKGFFCVWDLTAFILVIGGLFWYSKSSLKGSQIPKGDSDKDAN